MTAAYYTIIYEHPNQCSYKGIQVTIISDTETTQTLDFNTGDPILDWWNFIEWANNNNKKSIDQLICTKELQEWLDLGEKWVEKWMSLEDDTVYSADEALQVKDPQFYKHFMPIICTKMLNSLKDIKEYVRLHTPTKTE